MKAQSKFFLLLISILFTMLGFQNSYAQMVILYSVVGNGGGVATNSSYRVLGTLGQPFVGISNNAVKVNSAGFWSLPIEIITSVEETADDILPKEFRMDQNYPNPFNPSTTIQFAVPVKAEVTLKLFDLLGREVRTLEDKEFKPGVYKLVFEAEDLPSGIYFYRIKANSESGKKFEYTRRLTFVK